MNTLIPVFKDCTRQDIRHRWKVQFLKPSWVKITLENETYYVNRYDVQFNDRKSGKRYLLYVYMNEESTYVYAIDSVVGDKDENTFYPLEETPMRKIFDHLLKQAS